MLKHYVDMTFWNWIQQQKYNIHIFLLLFFFYLVIVVVVVVINYYYYLYIFNSSVLLLSTANLDRKSLI